MRLLTDILTSTMKSKIICILLVSMFSLNGLAQEKTIDMVDYCYYLARLEMAKQDKDKTKISELEKEYGAKYNRKTIEKLAKESTKYRYTNVIYRAECAYQAGSLYYQYYYHGRKPKHLLQAVNNYQLALKRIDHEDYEYVSQVAWEYACMLIDNIDEYELIMRSDKLSNEYYFNNPGKKKVYNTSEEREARVIEEIYHAIGIAADGGHKEAALAKARIFRFKYFPYNYNYSCKISPLILEKILIKKFYKDLEQCDMGHILGAHTMQYYNSAAENGRPAVQIEYAQYLWECLQAARQDGVTCYYDWEFTENYFSRKEIEDQIIYWYRQAAEQGEGLGMLNLAYCLYTHFGNADDTTNNQAEIMSWLGKASQNGWSLAYYNMSVATVKENPRMAIDYAKKGADSGDYRCMHLLGRYYYYGTGADVDKKEALRWFKKAADAGSMGAKYMTGVLYADKSVGNDMKKAVEYFKSAKDVREAWLLLADCYSKGEGTFMDKQSARECERKASYCPSYSEFVPEMCYGKLNLERDGIWESFTLRFEYWGHNGVVIVHRNEHLTNLL